MRLDHLLSKEWIVRVVMLLSFQECAKYEKDGGVSLLTERRVLSIEHMAQAINRLGVITERRLSISS